MSGEAKVQHNGGVVLLTVDTPNGRPVQVETTPSDCVLDVRNYLLDCPGSCEVTCYHLEHEGKILNDYVELAEYAQIFSAETSNHIRMVPDFYDERQARLHVRRLRQLFLNPPAHIATLTNLFNRRSRKQEAKSALVTTTTNGPHPKVKNDSSLLDLVDPSVTYATKKQEGKIKECVENISFSAWNPPPGNRQLSGDLLYLEVTTLEGNVLHITSSVDGFYLNRSTSKKFDPLPHASPYKSHSLSDLLKKASNLFSQRFSSLINRKIKSHPFENIPVPRAVVEWTAPLENHTYDWNRAEDSLLSTFGMDTRGVLRDWNEEYQSCKELPQESQADLMMRARTTYRVFSDYVEAAQAGAVAIIEGNIPPINPMEEKRAFVFIYNNIFFSYAIDGKDLYVDAGGDRVSYANANHDLKGIKTYTSLSIPGLHNLATIIVDYRGHRVIAQSIIPGIFHGDKVSSHVYGSMDQGQDIKVVEGFHSLLTGAADALNIKGHTIQNQDGKKVTLATCTDTKGIVGSDGRNYLLDLVRTTPRDANYPDAATHATALLRPELVSIFVRNSAMVQLNAARAQAKKALDACKTVEEKKKVPIPGNEAFQRFRSEPKFNCDLLTKYPNRIQASEEELKADLKLIQDASGFLVDIVIPKFIQDCKNLTIAPVDTLNLTQIMHVKGINMRYLGRIADLARDAKLAHLEALCTQEMIVRAAKTILGVNVREVKPIQGTPTEHWFLAPCIAQFLCSLVGPNAGGRGFTTEQLTAASSVISQLATQREQDKQDDRSNSMMTKKQRRNMRAGRGGRVNAVRLQDGSRAPTDPLDAVNVWQAIREEVTTKFSHSLPEKVTLSMSQKLTILRAICQKFGVQIAMRRYNLNENNPIKDKDILRLYPRVKFNLEVAPEGVQALNQGKILMSQGKLAQAFQYITGALNLFGRIYGPMHERSATCYAQLAQLCYQAGDFAKAVDHQESCLIICQRLKGIDHPDTAHAHSNLALYMHSTGHFTVALDHMRRAIFLFELIAGRNHPETAAAHMNIAMIYQDTDRTAEAVPHLHEARKRIIACLGESHQHVAACEHAIAVAYGLLGLFRQSIAHERKAKQMYVSLHDEQHVTVKQCQYWIDQFTARAVNAQQGNAPNSKMSLLSPLSWTSLRNKKSFKGRLTMNDVFKMLNKNPEVKEALAVAQQQAAAQAQAAAAAEDKKQGSEPDQKKSVATPGQESAPGKGRSKAQRKKDKKRRQQQAKREAKRKEEALAAQKKIEEDRMRTQIIRNQQRQKAQMEAMKQQQDAKTE